MIKLKTEQDIILYRETGRIAAEILSILKDHVKPGVDTYTIAKYAEELIVKKYDAIPSSIGQYDFKFALNSSINNVICHGVPSKDDVLKNGDIVNLDLTVKKHGTCADTSRMYLVGDVSLKPLIFAKSPMNVSGKELSKYDQATLSGILVMPFKDMQLEMTIPLLENIADMALVRRCMKIRRLLTMEQRERDRFFRKE